MTASTITKQGWDKIMKPLLRCYLPVAGYSQHFPRAVIFGPSKQGGKGLMHPWYNQELTHLETLWEELASETHTGEFITTSMEALRLELGYPTSLMSIPFDRMAGCATDSWLTSLWETCNKWNIDIKSIAPELQKARVYDQFVMQAFAQNKNITDKQLPILNKCRCFHQIVTLADAVTACGKYLERDVLDGKSAHPLHSYKWPKRRPQLKASYWKLWKAALLDTFTTPNSITNQLKDPLAEWLIDPAPYWKWRYVNDNGLVTIYKKRALYACRYTATHPTRQPRLRKLPQNVTLPEVPSTSMLISICSINDNMIQQLGNPHTDQFFQEDIDDLPRSWHERITDKSDNWMIQEVRTPECRRLLAESIRQGNAIGVSDGSYCPHAQKGSSAAAIQCLTTGQRLLAVNLVP